MHTAVAGCRGWRSIVSSPLRRCVVFAYHLAAARTVPVRLEPRLREIHFGAWEGRTVEDIACREPQALRRFWNEPGAWMPPGAEPFPAFQQRVVDAWRDTLRTTPGPVLLITHAGPIRVILCEVFHLPAQRLLEREIPLASLHTLLPMRRSTPVP